MVRRRKRKSNILPILGLAAAGVAAMAFFGKTRLNLAQNLDIVFKGIEFGMKGILPVAYLKLAIKNPTDYSDTIESIKGEIPTPKGALRFKTEKEIIIGPKGTVPFEFLIEPSLELIQGVVWLVKNWKTAKPVVNLTLQTKYGSTDTTMNLI